LGRGNSCSKHNYVTLAGFGIEITATEEFKGGARSLPILAKSGPRNSMWIHKPSGF